MLYISHLPIRINTEWTLPQAVRHAAEWLFCLSACYRDKSENPFEEAQAGPKE